MGSQCQEELQAGQLPQLEARAQRLSDHVYCIAYRQNGPIYGRFRSKLNHPYTLFQKSFFV